MPHVHVTIPHNSHTHKRQSNQHHRRWHNKHGTRHPRFGYPAQTVQAQPSREYQARTRQTTRQQTQPWTSVRVQPGGAPQIRIRVRRRCAAHGCNTCHERPGKSASTTVDASTYMHSLCEVPQASSAHIDWVAHALRSPARWRRAFVPLLAWTLLPPARRGAACGRASRSRPHARRGFARLAEAHRVP